MAIGSGKKRYHAPVLTGGLETRIPPTQLDPSQSPELLNVILHRQSVERRGGFPPFIRQAPRLDAVGNRGLHPESYDGTQNVESIQVPGALYGGDRRAFDQLGRGLTKLTVDCFLRIDDLSTETRGPVWVGADPLGAADTIAVRVRPILSKGPIKKTISQSLAQQVDEYGPPCVGNGAGHWNNTNAFGPAGQQFEMTSIFSGGGFSTITTREPHGLSTSDSVRLIGTGVGGVGVDGVRVVTVTGANTFTVPVAGSAPETGTVLTQPSWIGQGMPFCIYLFHDLTSWSFRFSSHIVDAGGPNFELRTVTSSVVPELGAIYHVIASIEWGAMMTLRIGKWNSSTGVFDYTGNQLVLAGTDATPYNTPGPVQVFDCPQDFIDSAAGVRPVWDAGNFRSQPPGLGLGAGAGGYFFASKRFEGAIDDILIRTTALTGASDTSADRFEKIDLDAQTSSDVLSYWSMISEGTRFVREESGRANHLFMTPDVPVLDDASGGIRSDNHASWWFNGRTSYGMLRLDDNPNHRYLTPKNETSPSDLPDLAYLEQVVRNSTPFGFQVEFWPDSIAEPFEQVLVESHSHMRCVVLPSGHLGVYYRDSSSNIGAQTTPRYVGPVQSSMQLQPGQRYSVLFFFRADDLEIYVNGTLDTKVTIGATSDNSWPVSGITVGMGARRWTNPTDDTVASVRASTAADTTATAEQINTDSRSGFVGRIERFAMVAGDGHEILIPSKDEDGDDWLRGQTSLFEAPAGGDVYGVPRNLITPSNIGDVARQTPLGSAVYIGSHLQNGVSVFYFSEALDLTQIAPDLQEARYGGANYLRQTTVWVFHKIGQWTLDRWNDDEAIRLGRYDRNVEYRSTFAVGQTLPDGYRWVLEQETPINDDIGRFGSLLARTIHTDDLCEGEPTFQSGGTWQRHGSGIVGKPYGSYTPRELGPYWTEGLVLPRTETVRPSLVKSWDDLRTSENFLIVGAGRNLYWAKPVWRLDSPFEEKGIFRRQRDGAVWMFGQSGEHVVANLQNDGREILSVGTPYSTVTVELWVKPQRIDGKRILAAVMSPEERTVNFLVGTQDGSLFVCGTLDGNTKAWLYHDGSNASQPGTRVDARLGVQGLRINEWNHVYVLIGGHQSLGLAQADCIAWINGHRRTLIPYNATAAGGTAADAIDSGTPDHDAITDRLYIGGLPQGFEAISLGFTAGSLEFSLQSWHGLLTEYRQTDEEEAAFSSASEAPGYPPLVRRPDAQPGDLTVFLIRFDELEGWVFANSVVGRESSGGVSQIAELVLIGSNLEQSRFARYDATVFRDRLYITNGASRPLELLFTRYSDPKGPFRVQRVGLIQPNLDQGRLTIETFHNALWTNQARRNYLAPGLYQLWIAFRDSDGRESEPTQMGVLQVAAQAMAGSGFNANTTPHNIQNGIFFTAIFSGTGIAEFDNIPWKVLATDVSAPFTTFAVLDWLAMGGGTPGAGWTAEIYPDGVRVDALPRSTEHGVDRLLYLSPFGGGNPRATKVVFDNSTNSAEIHGPGSDVGIAMSTGRKLIPPRARLIEVGAGTVFLGNLPRLGAGGAAFAWSDGEEITYFPATNVAVIDSEGGHRLIGLIAHLGRFYLSKRDSIWQFSISGTASPLAGNVQLRPVNQSIGVGGGIVVYDNIVFGSGERGVYRFDGANVAYSSDSLEGEWDELPVQDEDLLNHFGVFYHPLGQYWLSVRRPGLEHNDTIYVLDLTVGDRQVWTKFRVPEHTYMTLTTSPADQRPRVLLATVTGQILAYDADIIVDGHDDRPPPGQAEALLIGIGTVAGSTLTVIGVDELDTVRDGLRGMQLVLLAQDFTTYVRTVESNTATTLTFSEAVPNGTYTWAVGLYDSFWTSGWIGASAEPGKFLTVHELDLEFEPDDTSLIVSNATAITEKDPDGAGLPVKPKRILQDTGATLETRFVDLTNGYLDNSVPVKRNTRGRYFRILFGTSLLNLTGIRKKFSVQSWGFDYDTEGIRGGRPR